VEVRAFVALFGKLGYEQCANGALEEGYEKVVLFVDASGRPTHAARQAAHYWTSKIGAGPDIEHGLGDLDGPCYGRPTHFFRRRLARQPPAGTEQAPTGAGGEP
jgi:hypothetical protein